MAGPALTVDLVIKLRGGVVLVKRKNEPYKDCWALPGGFVEYGEKVEDAAVREAFEETGLRVKLLGLIGVYSDPNRDPRGHTVSICYLAKKAGGRLRSGSDAKEVGVFRKIPWGQLAFDHAQILKDAGFK
ncbi:MAG: NUDIX hydrolase [Hadesarchaea archaeon]|nr:NUDIX hydrolase [Hadesarchaea archaeon]